jgi:hypothetical protein
MIAGLAALVLAATIAAGVVSSRHGSVASADAANKAFFVDITTVAPNVTVPKNRAGAATGTFTVQCGKNENGHRNPDNFIAQPGVKNGAQHLHDYVGNLSTDADSTDASLAAAGTTCANGDQSTYFWPVVRVDTADNVPPVGASPSANGRVATVSCPLVANKLPAVPASAANEVKSNLALLDQQIAEANQRIASTVGQGGPNFVQNAILGPLKDKRTATIDRIAIAIGRTSTRPTGLDALAACTLNTSGQSDGASTNAGTGIKTLSAAAQAAAAPTVSCPTVANKLPAVPASAQAEVGRNLALLDQQIAEANQRLANTVGQGGPNFIQNAILGPLKDKRVATIDRIAIAIGRTAAKPTGLDALAACTLNAAGTAGGTGSNAGGALGGVSGPNDEVGDNDGVIQIPRTVSIQFRGSPVGKVVAMPRFLRILSGDAKQSTNGPANARAAWTCTGLENRLLDKYPICPQGSFVERIHDFPSCWDGKNLDSANHRTHVVFPDKNTGACPAGFKAIPQLRITLTYDIPRQVQINGQYKVDAFAQEAHNPLSDHDDFENVMSDKLMSQVVACVNGNRAGK